jgi:hypothetical protein
MQSKMKRPNITDADAIADEYAEMETIGEILAYIFGRKGGEPSLRELLEMPHSYLYRETLEKAAAEIEEAGMLKCSAIVRSCAAKAPPDDRHYRCPYPPDDHLVSFTNAMADWSIHATPKPGSQARSKDTEITITAKSAISNQKTRISIQHGVLYFSHRGKGTLKPGQPLSLFQNGLTALITSQPGPAARCRWRALQHEQPC